MKTYNWDFPKERKKNSAYSRGTSAANFKWSTDSAVQAKVRTPTIGPQYDLQCLNMPVLMNILKSQMMLQLIKIDSFHAMMTLELKKVRTMVMNIVVWFGFNSRPDNKHSTVQVILVDDEVMPYWVDKMLL